MPTEAPEDLPIKSNQMRFQNLAAYMARAVVLRTFSLSTLYLEMSKPTADSDNSLRGIPKAVLVCPSVWKPAIKESREARLELVLVLMPEEVLDICSFL